jgi:NAD(P)-dependent dehydrogenase (short-subunit alcohol dehydrogenase family)
VSDTEGLAPRDPVLITGTSSGIGLETAVYLAERGFQVHATMRDLGRRDRLDEEAARRHVQLQVLQLDVTDRASIESAVHAVVEASGSICGLVNNAGTLIQGYFEDVSDAEMRRVFETNVLGTMAVTRTVLPHMRAAGRGRIVIMSSSVGRVAAPASSAYCASKFALEGFGEALALEVAPWGLQVVLVEPGFVKTELFGRNRNVAARALDPQGPYYEWFQRLQEAGDSEVQGSSISPVDVARTVHRALTARRPNLRYIVRLRAKVLIALRRHLPGELFERIWFHQMARRMADGGQALGGKD